MKNAILLYIIFSLSILTCKALPVDSTAEKILLYQRDNGGWPQYHGDPTDYSKTLSPEFTLILINDKKKNDATIDDGSTTFEIEYLLKKSEALHQRKYLMAAEKGINYLMESQNAAGGFPQKFPDTSGYHKHITYNDEAMISVLWIIKHIAEMDKPFDQVSNEIKSKASISLQKGIDCILRTQYVQHDRLTVWCAQHDATTLAPASARKFEPASLSGKESVGIVIFLMSIKNPDKEIIHSIQAAKEWFRTAGIQDKSIAIIKDPSLPKGRDIQMVEKPGSIIWARFYDLDTNEPVFTGRDGIKRKALADIEYERRNGYAYLGTWPKKIAD